MLYEVDFKVERSVMADAQLYGINIVSPQLKDVYITAANDMKACFRPKSGLVGVRFTPSSSTYGVRADKYDLLCTAHVQMGADSSINNAILCINKLVSDMKGVVEHEVTGAKLLPNVKYMEAGVAAVSP
jgi:hypothetical protein